MRRLMLLLGLLAAMMLVASPVLAHPGGGTHGNKYSKNYYPTTYFKYCEPDGDQFDETNASEWCKTYYTTYTTKSQDGKKYYSVHVYYTWKTSQGGTWQTKDYWYYCAYHKYDDKGSTKPYFKAWVGYKPTGDYYWESFYHKSS